MRDSIARLLAWVLSVLTLDRPGRHSVEFLPELDTPTITSSWARPWTTPTPQHVIERHTPLRGEDIALVRPYVLTENMRNLRVVCERRKALAYSEVGGSDYPYTYDGALIPTSAFTAAGVSA